MILPSDRIHNTNSDTLVFENVPDSKQKVSHKPIGLWYSFGNQWLEWCKYEMPEWVKKNTFKLNITGCNILKITTPEQFKDFEREYLVDVFGLFKSIDWPRVTTKYDGIEIYDPENNYEGIWSVRGNDSHWYNTWDIGSGCIWRKCNVTSEKIEIEEDGKKSSRRKVSSKRRRKVSSKSRRKVSSKRRRKVSSIRRRKVSSKRRRKVSSKSGRKIHMW
jgi:hypothetical protein